MTHIVTTDDLYEAKALVSAVDMCFALDDIAVDLRRKYLKYGDFPQDVSSILEQVFGEIDEILETRNVKHLMK